MPVEQRRDILDMDFQQVGGRQLLGRCRLDNHLAQDLWQRPGVLVRSIPRIRPPRPRTARFRAGHVEERPYTSPVEAPRYRRSIYHTGPQTVRGPRRATRELDPSDDHRQTFDQREELDPAGHVEESPASTT